MWRENASPEAQELLKRNTPNSLGSLFHPQPGREANSEQQEIGDHDSEVAPG